MLKKAEGAETETLVEAIRVSTGLGKTRIAAKVIAENRRTHPATAPWLYLVPTHRLGEDIAKLFAEHGITALVFRGREAKVPGKNEQMCLNLDQVRLALAAGEPIAEACCRKKTDKNKVLTCMFYNTCAYQRQKQVPPDVWIAAHEALFHANRVFEDPVGVIIDEGFWQDGVRLPTWEMAIDEIRTPTGPEDEIGTLEHLRKKLAMALAQQAEPGGFRRQHLIGALTRDDCTDAIRLEWKLKPKADIEPGMAREKLAKVESRLPAIQFSRHMIAIWGAMRELIAREDIAVSGRLLIEQHKGSKRVIRLRGLAPIRKQWDAPTMLLDATLPGLPVLQVYYPNVEIIADLETSMPHVTVRQKLNAPVSATRLLKTSSDSNRVAIRRYILQRWIETGREPTLVICQEKYETWLKAGGLPDTIMVEHFNNIEGLDRYKDVRLLIAVGRTIPGPEAVEAMAGALTGAEPVKATGLPGSPRWYDPVVRGIRRADGRGVAVQCDQHPDPVCEAVRFQICEGELMQAIGRGRGVNRTAETPLDLDIVADVCLPVTVNEVSLWQEPSAIVEALVADGIFLVSPADMVKCWPTLWPTERKARWTLDRAKLCVRASDASPLRGASDASPLENIIKDQRQLMYRLTGQGMQFRYGFFDPKMIPDPKAWLERRLGKTPQITLVLL
jgi:putative DNA primase/helicase